MLEMLKINFLYKVFILGIQKRFMKSKKKKERKEIRRSQRYVNFFLFKGEILCMKFYDLLMYCWYKIVCVFIVF